MAALYRHRFKILLGTLLVLIVAMPVLFEGLAGTAPHLGSAVVMLGAFVFVLTTTLVVSGMRGARIFVLGLVVPTLLVEAAAIYFSVGNLLHLHYALRIIFVMFIIGVILREVFSPGPITFDTVCSSLCIYLLIGMIWENVYAIVEQSAPGSIVTVTRTPAENPQSGPESDVGRVLRMRYFSYATLTSVAYGDLVPGTTLARMLAITEALVGQMYLLVMVSRLVGLHVSQSMPGPAPPGNKQE